MVFLKKYFQPGCNVSFIADLWHKLMLELGYEKYGVQGGDFGAGVSTALSMKYPGNVTGMHLDYIPGNYVPVLEENEEFSADENSYLDLEEECIRRRWLSLEQNTKPLTLAYGLNDSPMGLCAWIIEKCTGGPIAEDYIGNVFSMDDLFIKCNSLLVTKRYILP